MSGWSAIRFLHVTAAIVWVGAQLTLSLVIRPAAARVLGEDDRRRLFLEAGRRLGVLANLVLIPMLVTTGLALAWNRGVTLQMLNDPGYGSTLGAKIGLAAVAFLLASLHGLIAVRSPSATSRALGIGAAVASLLVVLLATSLVS